MQLLKYLLTVILPAYLSLKITKRWPFYVGKIRVPPMTAWELENEKKKKKKMKKTGRDQVISKTLSNDSCSSKFMVNLPTRPNDTW